MPSRREETETILTEKQGSNMLTRTWLNEHRACLDARAEFRQLYPGGSAPLADVVAKLAEHPEGAGWFEWLLVRHPALHQHKASYDAVEYAAWNAYVEAAQPARDATVAAYDAAARAAMREIARRLAEVG